LAIRAFIVPILIVAIIYKLGHLEDWSRYDIALFMFFQIVMVCSVVSLFAGQFKLAFMMLGIFAAILVIVASFARSM